MAMVFGGPILSGALFLLLPTGTPAVQHDLPESYEPLHKGYVSLSNGLYVREDEDLVLPGTPPLVLRRTYLSGDRTEREFGIGTTHQGESFLIGDGSRFQWASLIRADGSRIHFDRTSYGATFVNAMYEHRLLSTEFRGARLGWTGLGWAMRFQDGSLSLFDGCGPNTPGKCGLIKIRDFDGHVIRFRRDASRRLLWMEASADRWIAFDYDDRGRITRAYDGAAREVRYTYDDRGRLSRVRTFDGKMRQYTYTDRDEMRTIADPQLFLENTYDAEGRCIRQVNRFPDATEPFTFHFDYRGEGRAIVQTDVRRSDGFWETFLYDDNHEVVRESWGQSRPEPDALIVYDRDPTTSMVTGMTVTCPDRTGRPLSHSSYVRPGDEERIKWDLVQTHCSWSKWRSRAE
jgi:YD repeat-containing protein